MCEPPSNIEIRTEFSNNGTKITLSWDQSHSGVDWYNITYWNDEENIKYSVELSPNKTSYDIPVNTLNVQVVVYRYCELCHCNLNSSTYVNLTDGEYYSWWMVVTYSYNKFS